MHKFDFIINRLSGTVMKLGEPAIEAGLKESFGERVGDIRFIDGKEITSSVQQWVAQNAGSERVMVIGGGDGTVLTAAEQIMGRSDVFLGVLPLGTHNLFARQLGFSSDFKKAAGQFNDSYAANVDVGSINGKYFLCGVMLDKNTVNFYDAREDLRKGANMTAAKKLLSMAAGVSFGRQRTLNAGDKALSGRVFFVMNNVLKPRALNAPQDNPSKIKSAIENLLAKDSHDDGLLALYALKGGALSTFGMVPAAVKGKWDQHGSVTVHTASEMVITDGKGVAGAETTVVLDGELTKTNFPLNIKMIPAGLRVFRPKG